MKIENVMIMLCLGGMFLTGAWFGVNLYRIIPYVQAQSHEYDADEYNCRNFSYDQAVLLNATGIPVCIVNGYHNGLNHAWIMTTQHGEEVHIESTTGSLINPEELGVNYTWCPKRSLECL